MNPYNGAVGIYYGNNDFVRMTKGSWVNNNQFRWEVTHSIYRRMAMLNIPENQSISYIRSNILLKRVYNNEQLNEKDKKIQELEIQLEQKKEEIFNAKQEHQEYLDTFGTNEKEISSMQAKLQYYQSLIERDKNEVKELALNFTEEEFYAGEVKDVVLELIEKAGKNYGDDQKKRRSYHILQDIINNNSTSTYRKEMIQEIREIIERGNVSERTLSELRQMGFVVKGNDHQKASFHGDKRYMITLASTPSEWRGGSNTAHDAIDLMFK